MSGAATSGAGADSWPPAGERPVETFRSSSARALALLWWALSLFALGDLAVRGRDHFAVSIAAGILLSDALVWVGAWRPGVELYPAHVLLRGSLRDRSVDLAAITDTRAIGPLVLSVGSRTVSSAAVSSTLRERRRAGRERSSVPATAFGSPGRGGGGRGGSGGSGRSIVGRGGLGAGGGLGGPGSSHPVAAAGFDDSRMDAATRDALVGRTPGHHAAERIADEARRRRAAVARAAAAAAPGAPGSATVHPGTRSGTGSAVSAARWLAGPAAAVALLAVAFVVAVAS